MKPADSARSSQAQGLFAILGRMAEGVFAVDTDYRIIFWNPEAQHLLGYSPEEILGRCCCDVLAALDPYNALYCRNDCPPMALTRIGQAVGTVDVLTQTKFGKQLWINLSTLPMPSQGIIVHFFRDHSAQRLIEQCLEAHGAQPSASIPFGSPDRHTAKPGPTLTKREHEVLHLLTSGSSTKRIAESLRISPTTVRNHVQNILSKLGAHSRLEAVVVAYQHHLFQI